jgi:hypothetical protein
MNRLAYVQNSVSACHTADLYLRLENLGLAGFSHEFKALVLNGETPELIHVIESFKLPASGDVLSKAFFFLSPLLPWLLKLPSENTRLLWRVRFAMKDIADNLLEKTKQELETDSSGEKVTDKSIIGTLGELPSFGIVRLWRSGLMFPIS